MQAIIKYRKLIYYIIFLVVLFAFSYTMRYDPDRRKVRNDMDSFSNAEQQLSPSSSAAADDKTSNLPDVSETVINGGFQSSAVIDSDDKNDEDPLIKYVRTRAGNLNGRLKAPTIILTYASYSYIVPLMNWLIYMQRLNLISIVGVVCIDKEMTSFLESRGFKCFPLHDQDSSIVGSTDSSEESDSKRLSFNIVQKLWVIRITHLVTLLSNGFDVIFSDTDAIWLKDPFETKVFVPENGDIVSGKGQFPWNVAQSWGAAVCMGVVYFHSTDATVTLIQTALVETMKSNDDQIGLNTVLYNIGGRNSGPLFGRKLQASGPLDASATFKFRNNKKSLRVKLALVSHNKIPRFCNLITPATVWEAEVVIAHCHPADGVIAKDNMQKGNEKTHSNVLVKYNLYQLKESWETEEVNSASFEVYLSAIDKMNRGQ